MASVYPRFVGPVKRIDLHCHSNASNEASEAMLSAIKCPESFSTSQQVYNQAVRRGMDFVTITDHDAIDGVLEIADRPNVLVGEEVSCFFPEDQCKIHLLVYGITPAEHGQLQARAKDIYSLARYVAQEQITHVVAHPLYRNNDRLQRWHVERLLLMFKGFECLNGAHSGGHRDAFEQCLENLTPDTIVRLAERNRMSPLWPEPHIKSCTGGSDDHGLLNIGRTWTEFPNHVRTPREILDCLRNAQCRPAGSAGESIKLAHQFYSVAVRYFSREMLAGDQTPSLPTMLMQTFVGEGPALTKKQLLKLAIRHKIKGIGKALLKPWKSKEAAPGASRILNKSFLKSAKERITEHPELVSALERGEVPLAEHAAMFSFVSKVNSDVTAAILQEIQDSVKTGRLTGIFDGIAAVMAQQFVSLPYYFAFHHQQKERPLLRELTGLADLRGPADVRVGLFTDTLDEVNGVSRFIRDMSSRAESNGCRFTVHTCSSDVRFELPNRRNFKPVASYELPYYPELPLNLPPVLEILEWAERQQFDAIEVSTPGPMGLMGILVAKMLRIPVLGTYHTDFPAYVANYTGDDRLADVTIAYMKWFYGQMSRVFTRSKEYSSSLLSLGIAPEKIAFALPGIDTETFNPRFRAPEIWAQYEVEKPFRIIYVGRVSNEKNLPLLEEAFKRLVQTRRDVALVVVGDGPYRETMERNLRSYPAHFLGFRHNEELSRLYASADLCVFPSRTDTLGQVVMEAQASGLPVLVSDEGGPKEMMDHKVTGMVLSSTDANAWTMAMAELLDSEAMRAQMSRNAVTRIHRFSLERTFETFWNEHAACVLPQAAAPAADASFANQDVTCPSR